MMKYLLDKSILCPRFVRVIFQVGISIYETAMSRYQDVQLCHNF